MIALKITGLGSFMSRLFSGNTFDSFLLAEGTLRMGVTWQVDGKLNRDFFDKSTWEDPSQRPYDYAAWSQVRPSLRELIRGKKAPASIRYKDGEATLLSGISMKSFTINKNADILWDKAIRRFLQSKGIAFEPLS